MSLLKKKAVLFPIKLTLYSILFESNLYYKTQINLAHRAFYHIKKNIACLKAFFWVCSSELYKCNSPSAASSPVFNYESASTTSILLVSSSAVTFWGVHFLDPREVLQGWLTLSSDPASVPGMVVLDTAPTFALSSALSWRCHQMRATTLDGLVYLHLMEVELPPHETKGEWELSQNSCLCASNFPNQQAGLY